MKYRGSQSLEQRGMTRLNSWQARGSVSPCMGAGSVGRGTIPVQPPCRAGQPSVRDRAWPGANGLGDDEPMEGRLGQVRECSGDGCGPIPFPSAWAGDDNQGPCLPSTGRLRPLPLHPSRFSSTSTRALQPIPARTKPWPGAIYATSPPGGLVAAKGPRRTRWQT